MANVLHDDYIASAPEFAVPILERLRAAVHKACPDVKETMKWANPHYEHCGVVGSVAAFKNHVNFGFARGRQMNDPEDLLELMGETEIGVMRFESEEDLPSDSVLIAYLKEARRLNEDAPDRPVEPEPSPDAEPTVPGDLAAAIRRNKTAAKTFQNLEPAQRREYVEWIHDAKREATRERRIQQTVEWLAEGKAKGGKVHGG